MELSNSTVWCQMFELSNTITHTCVHTHTPPVVETCFVRETGLSVAPDSKQRCEAMIEGTAHQVGYVHPLKHKTVTLHTIPITH